MKRLLVLLLLASTLAVACASEREPAEMAVQGLETSAANARPDIERFAPDRMAAVYNAVATVRAKFDGGNYPRALADVPGATDTVTSAAQAAAAKKAQWSIEWAAFAGMPAMVGQIKAKLAELTTMRRLPRGMDRARLASAKSSLDSVTSLWDEASDAHTNGNLVVAVSKATDAKPIVESLMTTVGLSAPASK